MDTPTIETIENPADNLVEFIELLEEIEVTSEKIAKNSISMTNLDGTVIMY